MERYYIFFRCWQGFGPDFPYEKFDRFVRDRKKQLVAKLDNRAKQMTRRPESPEEPICANSHSVSPFMPRRPRKLGPGPECSLGCRNAWELGWITVELRKFGDWSPSPKCFLMRVDEAGFAANVVEALTEWWPTSQCRVLYGHLNPRFGYVPSSQFTTAVQAVIEAGMDGLPVLKPADVREELQKLAAAKAMELGESLIRICKSGTSPDVTVADQTNVDLPDEEIDDAIEAYMANYPREHKSEFDRRVGDRAKKLSAALMARAKQRTHRPAAPEGLVPVSCDTGTPAGAAGTTESGATVAVTAPRATPAEDTQGAGRSAGTGGADAEHNVGHRDSWEPPKGYVRVSTILANERFQKKGKNPSRSSIQRWEEKEPPAKIERDPASNENCYAEEWVMRRLKEWNPQLPKTQ